MKNIGQMLGAYDLTLELPLWVDSIHCFLFKGEDGWDLLDTGIYTSRNMERWEESFNRLGIRPSDIRKIVLTHPHVDHFGAAGELQKITRAPVQMPGNNTSTLFLKEWLKEVLADNIFNRFGLPEELKKKVIAEKILQFKAWAPSIPDIEDLRGQESIVLGSQRYRILRFAGHCTEQVCFYHPEKELLIAGDVLVAPNHLQQARYPLKDYFHALKKLQEMKISCLVPSHGKPFSRVGIRVGLIAEYRKRQLAVLKERLSQKSTVYEAYLFLLSSGDALADLFFGLAEVYYFLEYLAEEGDLCKIAGKDRFYYQKVKGGDNE